MTKSKLLILLATVLLSGFAMEGSTAAAASGGAGAEDRVATIDLWFKPARGAAYSKPFDPNMTVGDAMRMDLFSKAYVFPKAFQESLSQRILERRENPTLGSLYKEGFGTKEHPFVQK